MPLTGAEPGRVRPAQTRKQPAVAQIECSIFNWKQPLVQ
jgi:hypothetical protein